MSTYRQFTVTMTTTPKDVYSLITALPGALPTDTIISDRVEQLFITPSTTNVTAVYQTDQTSANGSYMILNQIRPYQGTKSKICLREFRLYGQSGGETVSIELIG